MQQRITHAQGKWYKQAQCVRGIHVSAGRQSTELGRAASGMMSEKSAGLHCNLQAKKALVWGRRESKLSRQSSQNNGALCPFPKTVTSSLVTALMKGKFLEFQNFSSSIVHTELC